MFLERRKAMTIPKAILNRQIKIHFFDGKTLEGEISHLSGKWYEVAAYIKARKCDCSLPEHVRVTSHRFLRIGKNFVKVNFNSPFN